VLGDLQAKNRGHVDHLPSLVVARDRLDLFETLAASRALLGVVERHPIRPPYPAKRPARMALLCAGGLGAPTSEALGLGFGRGKFVARRRLTRVTAVHGEPVFELVDPGAKRGDHFSVLVELRGEGLDKIDDGIDALLVNRDDVLTRNDGVGASYSTSQRFRNRQRLTSTLGLNSHRRGRVSLRS
jgi:hypothetical protein